jgi:CelD/BcsL family acetyltransferase involved in cellulose biosynthesis
VTDGRQSTAISEGTAPATGSPEGAVRVVRGGNGMKVHRLSIARLGAEDLASWRELVEAAVEPNPCYEPEFLRPAAAALGPADMELVIVTERGRWRALVPVQRVWRLGRVPAPAVATWADPLSFLDTPLIHAGAVEAAVAKVAEEVAGRGSMLGLVVRRLADGPVADALTEALAPARRGVVLESYTRAAAYRSDAPNGDGSSRTDRKKARRVERSLGPLSVDRRVGDAGSVEEFLALEASGWKGRGGTAMASRPAQAEFFRRMARGFAERGALETVALRAGSELLAMKVNLVAAGVRYHMKITYDERYGRFSPGRLLEQLVLEAFREEESLLMMDGCASRAGSVLDDVLSSRRRIMALLVPSSAAARRLAAPVARRHAERVEREAGERAARSPAVPDHHDGPAPTGAGAGRGDPSP